MIEETMMIIMTIHYHYYDVLAKYSFTLINKHEIVAKFFYKKTIQSVSRISLQIF